MMHFNKKEIGVILWMEYYWRKSINIKFLLSNPRLSMMVKSLEKMLFEEKKK